MSHVLIAAPARSGTTYMTTVLNRAGLLTGHEEIFADFELRPWGPWRADSSCYFYHYPLETYEDITVFHLVRDPLKVLQSNVCAWNQHTKHTLGTRPRFEKGSYVGLHCEEARRVYPDPVQLGLEVCYLWTRRGTEIAHKTLHVEEIGAEEILEIGRAADRELDPKRVRQALDSIPRGRNQQPVHWKRESFNFGWDDLPECRARDWLRDFSRKHGYESNRHAAGVRGAESRRADRQHGGGPAVGQAGLASADGSPHSP